MQVIDIIRVIEKQFGRQSHQYLMDIINECLLDIANKRKDNEETAVTSLLEGQRYYPLPKNLIKIETVSIKKQDDDGVDRFLEIPEISKSSINIGDES
tara:strand:+ start:1257 stop:1550 length:294 start_codon:yes stop_codon:yes gene_type:complete